MNHYKSCSELKGIAREKLRGKYGSSMLVSPIMQFLIAFIISLPLELILWYIYILSTAVASANGADPESAYSGALIIIYGIISIVITLLSGIVQIGIWFYYLNIACGKHSSLSDILCGFRWHFKKALSLTAIMFLIGIVCMLPDLFFTVLNALEPQSHWKICADIAHILGYLASIIVDLYLSQSYFLLLDFPKTGVRDLLKLSCRIMKGHKGRLLYMQLSFLPLHLLCICSFFIGYLWVIPYMNMTRTLFFLDIMQPVQTKEVVTTNIETEKTSELY